MLLTPTRARWSSRSEASLDPDRVTLVPLDEVMEWGDGAWRRSPALEHYLAAAPPRDAGRPDAWFRVDTGTFTVWCGEKSCPLGNTVGFRAISRLARIPGIYIPIHRLLDDVWDGDVRSKSAVQKTMSGLRRLLKEHGLHEVTIDGSQSGHYALKISADGTRHAMRRTR